MAGRAAASKDVPAPAAAARAAIVVEGLTTVLAAGAAIAASWARPALHRLPRRELSTVLAKRCGAPARPLTTYNTSGHGRRALLTPQAVTRISRC